MSSATLPKPKRIEGIDLFRGMMIFYVILLHPLLQRVFAQSYGEFSTQMTTLPLWVIIIGIPFIIVALWGTVFTFLAGFATAYQVTTKMQENPSRSTMIDIFRGRLANAVLIMVAHYIFLSLFTNKSPDFGTLSLFTGYYETQIFGSTSFSFLHFFTGGTLESIAFSTLFVAGVFRLLWINGKVNPQQAVKIFFRLTVAILLITIIAETIEPNPKIIADQFFANKQYLAGILYMRCFSVRFSLFPVLSFSCLGAMLGTMFAAGYRFRSMCQISLGFFITGILVAVGYYLNGFDLISHFTEEHTPIMMQMFNLGAQSSVTCIFLYIFDQSKPKSINSSFVIFIRKILLRYNSNSLTIFVIEPFFSILWFRWFLQFTSAPISQNLGLLIGYELTVIFTWFVILWVWEKMHFKYNMEWFIARGKDYLTSWMDRTIAYPPTIEEVRQQIQFILRPLKELKAALSISPSY